MKQNRKRGAEFSDLVGHQSRVFKVHRPKPAIARATITKAANGTSSCHPVNCKPANIHVMCVVSGALRQGKKHPKNKVNAAQPGSSANSRVPNHAFMIEVLSAATMPNDQAQRPGSLNV
jgi:hypothetical protein